VIAGAAGLSFGPFTETPADDLDATVSTVLGGTANTIREALPHLERSRGAIVVIGSIASQVPLPGLAAYTASKHALAGLHKTLRAELADARTPVTVSLVSPGAVDTPLWNTLESATGLLPPPPPDLYSPRSVADAIVSVVRRPRPKVVVGGSARAQVSAFSHLGVLALRGTTILSRMAKAAGDRPAGAGGLHTGRGAGEIEGGFGGRRSLTVGVRSAVERARRAVGTG
jgi:NAD(P)-dependent dehydrogenase (short-subunit alcohol dehydrogenase family)